MKLPPPINKPWWIPLYEYHGRWEHNNKYVKARYGYGTSTYIPGYNNATDYLLFHEDFVRWIDDDTFMSSRTPGLHIRQSDDFEVPHGSYYEITVKPDPDVPGGFHNAGRFQNTMGVEVVESWFWAYPNGTKWIAIKDNLRHVKDDLWAAYVYWPGFNYQNVVVQLPDSRFYSEDALIYQYA